MRWKKKNRCAAGTYIHSLYLMGHDHAYACHSVVAERQSLAHSKRMNLHVFFFVLSHCAPFIQKYKRDRKLRGACARRGQRNIRRESQFLYSLSMVANHLTHVWMATMWKRRKEGTVKKRHRHSLFHAQSYTHKQIEDWAVKEQRRNGGGRFTLSLPLLFSIH